MSQTISVPAPKVEPKARSHTIRNIFSNWGSYGFSIVVTFFIAPYVVRHLGDTEYGVWSLVISLTGYLGLLDLGVRGAVTRYVARFHTQGNHKESNDVASAAMAIFVTAGILAVTVSAILAILVIPHMKVPPQYLVTAKIVLVITGVSVAASLINGVYGGVLVGLQRFDLTNIIEVVNTGLRAVAIVVALHGGYKIVALALIQLFFTLTRLGAGAVMAHRLYPELRVRLWTADRERLRLIFSFSVFSFLLHVSSSLIYATDSIVIGAYLPVTAITFYVIGGNLVEYARALVSGISQTMTPLASSIEARQDKHRLQELVLMSSRSGTMVAVPIALTFVLRGGTFIGLWMGHRYAELSGHVLWILALTIFFWAGNSPTAGIMLGLSKHKPIVPILLAEGLANLALSILWVKKMGILGVAWGTAVPNLMANLIFWPWYVQRTLGIRPLRYIISAWVRPTGALVPFGLTMYALERYWAAPNLIVFFLQVGLCLPFALIGYWLLCLSRTQRENYSRKFLRS